jgi:hypothetical protein
MNGHDPDDDPTPPRDFVPSPVPAPAPDHPVNAVKDLVMWGRANGVAIGPYVEIGGLRVQVRDLRQAKIEGFAHGSGEDEMPPDFQVVLGRE